MENGYIIHCGTVNSGPTPIVATPNKKGEPTGEVMEREVRVGVHQLINRARVWGRRVIGDVKSLPEGESILTTSKGYRGELEFLEWGDEDGHAIDIRYLPESVSLDFEYQQNIQKIQIDPNTGFTFIELKSGQNQFDYKKQALLIRFLKAYPGNRDSKSKNPDPLVKSFKFYEVTSGQVDQTITKQIESGAEAVRVVMEISNKPGNLVSLLKALGRKFPGISDLSLDLEIYKVLLQFANNDAEEFFKLVNGYKDRVRDDFKKATSFKALDITKNGHIAIIIDNKPHLLTSEAEGKKEEMIEWFVENYYNPEIYKQTQVLKELVSKLK